MSKEFQIERHKTLWEEKTKQAKRIVYGGLLFGVLIFVNVLTPYSEDLKERNKIELDIKPYVSEIEKNEKALQQLNELEKVLKDIKRLVKESPWDTETQKLISKFREINIGGGASWNKYQTEADTTIDSVAALVKQNVIEPLSDFLKNSSSSDNLSPKLIQELKTIPEAVNTWVKENKGKKWYLTIESKEAQVDRLSNTLGDKLNSVSSEIELEKPKLTSRQNQLKKKVKKLKDNPELKKKKDRLKQLQAQMDKILPELIRGLISVEQMVQIFPFIVVLLAIYALNISLSAASHYRFLALKLNLGEVSITDPSFSSLWASTYRGKFGTILTIGVYTIFTLAMWFFFEFGAGILTEWLQTRNAWFINKDTFPIISWFCRMILVVVIVSIVIHPYFRERKFQGA